MDIINFSIIYGISYFVHDWKWMVEFSTRKLWKSNKLKIDKFLRGLNHIMKALMSHSCWLCSKDSKTCLFVFFNSFLLSLASVLDLNSLTKILELTSFKLKIWCKVFENIYKFFYLKTSTNFSGSISIHWSMIAMLF